MRMRLKKENKLKTMKIVTEVKTSVCVNECVFVFRGWCQHFFVPGGEARNVGHTKAMCVTEISLAFEEQTFFRALPSHTNTILPGFFAEPKPLVFFVWSSCCPLQLSSSSLRRQLTFSSLCKC